NAFAGGEVKVLATKTLDHTACKGVDRTRIGNILNHNFIDSLKPGLCLGRAGTRDNQLRVQLFGLRFTEQSWVLIRAAPAKVDDLVFFLVLEHGKIRRGSLSAKFLDAILQPDVGTSCGLVLSIELVINVGVGNGISHLGRQIWVERRITDIEYIAFTDASDG